MTEELFVPLLLIILALLIISITVTAAAWDKRKNGPRAERGVAVLSSRLAVLPDFAKSEYSVVLDEARKLLRQKRYRECIRRTGQAADDIAQLMEVVRQGRAEIRSIEFKVEEAKARGLIIDREAIGLDSVSRFWGIEG